MRALAAPTPHDEADEDEDEDKDGHKGEEEEEDKEGQDEEDDGTLAGSRVAIVDNTMIWRKVRSISGSTSALSTRDSALSYSDHSCPTVARLLARKACFSEFVIVRVISAVVSPDRSVRRKAFTSLLTLNDEKRYSQRSCIATQRVDWKAER